MSWLSKLKNAFRPRQLDEELLEEINDHIDRKIRALNEQGLDPADARVEASRTFGNTTRVREQTRELRMFGAVESALQDLRYAWRGMRKNPAFSVTAILSLTLAIASITAIYSVIDAAMLRPLPVPAPERLFTLSVPDVDQPGSAGRAEREPFSYPLFLEFRTEADKSARLALFSPTYKVEAQGPNPSSPLEKVRKQYVSGQAFEILRVPPAVGRLFSTAEDQGPGQHPKAVLSYDYWRRRFNEDPSIVGRNIRVDNRTYEVIGIAQKGFSGVEPGRFVDVWLPVMMFDPEVFVNRAINWSRIMGRLAPNTTREQLQARLQPAFHDDQEEAIKRNPSSSKEMKKELHDMTLQVHSGAEGFSSFRQVFGRPLWIVLGVAGGILLIACSNVASLMLARATARSGEMAMRISLGASRSRLVRQMLTESLLLSAIASCLGFALASVGAPMLVRLISKNDDPLRLVLAADIRVLLFCIGVCTLCALFFGVLPAWRAAEAKPMFALRHEQGQANRLRMGRLFVSIQVAFAFCLIVVGAGFLFTLHNLFALDTGFDATDVSVLTLSTDFAAQQGNFTTAQMQELRNRIAALKCVRGVACAWWAIFDGSHRTDRLTVPGEPPSDRAEIFYRVSPGYFATLKIPLLEGRDLTVHDSDGQSLVAAVVNRAFAQRYFGRRTAVGQQFLRDDGVRQQIVGVVANSYYGDLHHGPEPVVYFPMKPAGFFTVYVRSTLAPSSELRLVEREIKAMGRANHVYGVTTLEALVGSTLLKEKMLAAVGGVFAFLGLQLAAIGLFGLLNYAVGRRTKEIGIRAALGARRGQIAWLVAKDLLTLAGGGLVAGVVASLTIMAALRSMLSGVGSADPGVFATAAVVFLVAMLLAGSLPAMRAVKVDPTRSLRYD